MTQINSYTQQLIEDLNRIAHKAEDYFSRECAKINIQNNQGMVPEFKAIGTISPEELSGFTEAELPHSKHLSDHELKQLFGALLNLLQSYHFVCDFPNLMTDLEKYDLLRKNWHKKQKLALMGESHIEFCFSETENCNFKGKCSICDDLEDED